MLVFSLLIGCTQDGAWLNDEVACHADPYDWWGNLTYWTDHGEVAEGSARTLDFSIALGEGWVNNVNGSYNTANGNFEYKVNYASDSFLNKSRTDPDFDNFGTVYKNGNLDVRAKVEFEDVLGDTWSEIRREERQGCEGEVRVRYGVQVDGEEVHPKYPQQITAYTIANENRIDFNRERDFGEDYLESSAGYWKSDFTTHEEGSRDYNDGSLYEYAQDTDATNKRDTAWTWTGNDIEYFGDTTRRPDGSGKASYLVTYKGEDYVTVATDVAYSGAGTGTETWHRTGDVCNTTFDTEGECERDCSGDCYTEP
jgi:hypothetical protein